MTIAAKPPAEVSIDSVRALLREQHADLASLALLDIDEGWDNCVFRLGEDLAVRIPRRAASASLIEQEQQWLPQLSGPHAEITCQCVAAHWHVNVSERKMYRDAIEAVPSWIALVFCDTFSGTG
jgi:aminoglycoside phosphotransferase (APT) family kinase protein